MSRGAVIAVDINCECRSHAQCSRTQSTFVCLYAVYIVHVFLCLPSTDMEPMAGVIPVDNGDVTHPDTWQRVLAVLRGHQADVVMRWVC